jgi:hypothetical protein
VYSVGEDGRDDTSTGVTPPPEPQFGWSTAVRDQWRDVTRWSPPGAATAPGDEDDEDHVDDEDG